jgi:Acyl-protein synthetase, LuxE
VFSAAESDALHARVRAFLVASLREAPAEAFDPLALDLARFQARHVPALARLARARGVDLSAARAAAAIPAVPCDVFRLSRVAVHPPACDVATFRTSGTSWGVAARGEHPLRTTETYELAALGWAPRFLWPDRVDLAAWVLAPSLAEQPDSSLGFMLDRFAHGFEARPSFLVHPVVDGGSPGHVAIDLEGVARAAARAREAGGPVIVLATSFALVHLLDQAGGLDLRLPPGSRVMQTGGFKGRSREVSPDDLRRRVGEAFGVREDLVVGEYGMTELSSQLYEGTLAAALGFGPPARHGVYLAPPWVRVDAVDPVSLEHLPPGEVGIARVVDLANVDSAVAIQTADRVRVVEGGVELLGRLPGAAPRGCSLAVDEMLGGG